MSPLIRRWILPLMFLWNAWPAMILPQSSSANFKITKDIFDGGNNPSQSTNFKLNESIGFPLATGRMESAAFKLESGFLLTEKQQLVYASISGRVVDYQGQDPVMNAKITMTGALSKDTTTNNQGRYTLPAIPVGTKYTVQPKQRGMFFQPPLREYSPLNAIQTDQDFTGSLYGDVSGNDEVRAFDASMVLRYVVGAIKWQDLPRDSIAAEVSGDGSIKSFDASLILRFAAGLITQFPVEGGALNKAVADAPVILRLETQSLPDKNLKSIFILIETSEPVYSCELELSFDPAVMKLVDIANGKVAAGFLLAHAERNNEIRIALAGTHPIQKNGALLHLECALDADAASPPLTITSVRLNEGSSPVQIFNGVFAGVVAPEKFHLWQNFPNPFNPVTMIQYQIPDADSNVKEQVKQGLQVKLQVYNLLGEKVRTLVDAFKPPGSHRVIWDGVDDHGKPVASGVYLYRLEAGNFVQVKKMLFLP